MDFHGAHTTMRRLDALPQRILSTPPVGDSKPIRRTSPADAT